MGEMDSPVGLPKVSRALRVDLTPLTRELGGLATTSSARFLYSDSFCDFSISTSDLALKVALVEINGFAVALNGDDVADGGGVINSGAVGSSLRVVLLVKGIASTLNVCCCWSS